MSKRVVKVIPVNRVEGDLEIHVEMADGEVVNARCAGVMYRGFENLMVDRGLLDGLVITPRICGICTTSHLYAAAKALDMIYNVRVPPLAQRVRNIALLVEHLQNDLRHAFLMFMPDFCSPAYSGRPLQQTVLERYTPLKGSSVVETVKETAKLLEIIAILGGQWPHSSFMVPGGVFSVPSAQEVFQSLYILRQFRAWYENRVLGCKIEEWREIRNRKALLEWVETSPSHAGSDLGVFIRVALERGLDEIGRGCGNFVNFGLVETGRDESDPETAHAWLSSPGIVTGEKAGEFDPQKISEDISHAWFADKPTPRHPFKGRTVPYASGSEDEKYSWTKAPRYEAAPCEAGPLAEALASGDPLFKDLTTPQGASVFCRELARLVRPCHTIPALERWLEEIPAIPGKFYREPSRVQRKTGFGLVEAPRGALGHWVVVKDDKIVNYQVITPTAWNASPKDARDVMGPMEQALMGTRISDPAHPVELYHVVHSYDPCLVCTVHAIRVA